MIYRINLRNYAKKAAALNTEFEFDVSKYRSKLEANLSYLNQELQNSRVGRNSKIFDNLKIQIDGKSNAFSNVAQTIQKDANSLLVLVPDEQLIKIVEKTIKNANLGLNPIRQGNSLKVQIPKLTDEGRKATKSKIHELCEKSRIFIRRTRQDGRKEIKKENGTEEDEKMMQALTDEYIKKIDLIMKQKEKELDSL
jgi:ribosome recycling factor